MKNKLKSKLIAAMTITLMNMPTVNVFAADFTDVKPSDWYYSTVTKLADTGIVNGTGDGSFNPTGEVGIDAFVKMLFAAQCIQADDVESDYWAEKYFVKAYRSEYRYTLTDMYCYKLGAVNKAITSQPITREQMCSLIAKALEIDGNMSSKLFDSSMFSDYSSISEEYTTAVRTAVVNGIMGGKDNGVFDPKATVTRAEAAAVIARYMYPEERLAYSYTPKEEKHNVGDTYTNYNTWAVPVEVKYYETNQAIPTVSQVSMLYVQELDKYLYAGMPVSELEEIMGCKATKDAKLKNSYYFYTDDGKIKMSYTQKGSYIDSFAVRYPYNASFNGHSIGEKPMLMDEYILRTEYEEYFTNGGAIDMYPHIDGTYEMNGIKIRYSYYTDGCTQEALDRWGIPNGTERHHLPTMLVSIDFQGFADINRTLGIE